jgi:hypothetical protein
VRTIQTPASTTAEASPSGAVSRSPSTSAASAIPESGWTNWIVATRAIPPRASAQYQPT